MEEKLINLDTAKLAKEKGLTYDDVGQSFRGNGEFTYSNSEYFYPAPTQALLQKWLREIHNIYITIHREVLGSDEWGYSYNIEYLPKDKSNVKRRCKEFIYIESFYESIGSYTGAWDTYEEAFERGLFKALKLI